LTFRAETEEIRSRLNNSAADALHREASTLLAPELQREP
jgi:hypothetical protein